MSAKTDYEARFDKAVTFVLKNEGGYSNDKNDPGGMTNFGISLRYLKNERIDIDYDGDIDVDDIRAVDEEKARLIYRGRWWDKYGYNAINDIALATKVFDMSVNMGAKQAHKILQRSANEMLRKSLIVDGILGWRTKDAVNILNNKLLLEKLKFNSEQFYRNLVHDKPELKVFLRGWVNRSRLG